MSVELEPERVVLYINPFHSRCGKCGGGCDPRARSHQKRYGYSSSTEPGCGATWTHVSSDYANFEGLYDSIRSMRPDLEFIDPWPKS